MDPSLPPYVPLPLLNVKSIRKLAIACLNAAIVAIDNMSCLTFVAIERALRDRPSFVCHDFWSISYSTSFTSGLYTKPFGLLRKYRVKKGDLKLLR